MKNIITLLIIIIALTGCQSKIEKVTKETSIAIQPFEGFESSSDSEPRCPNLLIQYGAAFYLYNSSLARVPGVNPVQFANLEEYTEFLEWQQSQNIRCPVLYVRNTYDADGNEVFRVAPSVFEPQDGLPQASITTNSRASALNLEHAFAPRNLVNPQVNNAQFTDSLFPSME